MRVCPCKMKHSSRPAGKEMGTSQQGEWQQEHSQRTTEEAARRAQRAAHQGEQEGKRFAESI